MLWGELANGADTAASLQLAERLDDPRCTVNLLRRLSKKRGLRTAPAGPRLTHRIVELVA